LNSTATVAAAATIASTATAEQPTSAFDTTPVAQTPAQSTDDIPEWLRELQAQAEPPASTDGATQQSVPFPTVVTVDADPETSSASKIAAAGTAAFLAGAAADNSEQTKKPQLGEIKLTGDSYDYSDISGEVTDEMRAELAANASSTGTVDDEVALARRLMGLEPEAPTSAAPAAGVSAAAAAAESAGQTTAPDENPHWVAALAAASSAAVAAEKISHAEPEYTAAEPSAETSAAVPAALASDALAEQAATPLATPVESPSAELDAAAPVATESQDRDSHLGGIAAAAASGYAVSELSHAQDQASEAVLPIESPPPEAAALEEGEMPNWLREIAPKEFSDSAAQAATAAAQDIQPAGATEIPDWVKGLGAAAAAGAVVSHLPDLDENERQELPDWLREPVEQEPGLAGVVAAGALAAELGAQTELEPALELPAWFIAGKAPDISAREPYQVVETTGPLAGISGILPLALAITEPHHLTTPTPARSDGGRVFQTLLAEPLVSASQAPADDKTRSLFSTHHLLYLLIFLAAFIPLFFGLDQAGLGLDATRSATAGFYDQLQAIQPNSTVLVAFDYLPGAAIELDPAANAIIADVAARNSDVVAVSSNPNGAAIAESTLSAAREANPNFVYTNVGYIPGNESGLRVLASGWLPASRPDVNGVPWSSSPLAGRVSSMNDLALTVLLVGDDATLRAWMEQVEPRITSPIAAATSAMLEPQARNYVNAGQLQASLRGLTGAAELELLSNTTGQAVKTMDAFSIVSLVLAGIIIAANVVFLVRRRRKSN
jgi:hypothetical protein